MQSLPPEKSSILLQTSLSQELTKPHRTDLESKARKTWVKGRARIRLCKKHLLSKGGLAITSDGDPNGIRTRFEHCTRLRDLEATVRKARS
jgi:hypothetical protein